jgi:CRISPR-associated protein Cas5d
MPETPLSVRVWGDFACFTRPEFKVERVTYPVPTPSAVRGILEAIFWKPQFFWQIATIAVLSPIRYFSILRNEANDKQSFRAAQGWLKNGGNYRVDEARHRARRHTRALREVNYLITARIVLRADVRDDPAKYRDQFRRRVQDGRCFSTPYFGCREFPAAFGPSDGSERPIELTENLGPMLFDLDYASDDSGRGVPRFFAARLERGVLRVPDLYAKAGNHAT